MLRSDRLSGPRWELVLALVLVVGVVLLPTLGASSRMVYLAGAALIAAIVGAGFYVPFALTGQLSMAIVSCYGASSITTALVSIHWGWSFAILLPLGVAIGALAGGLFALPVLRTSGHYFIVVTFALVELFAMVGENWSLVDPNRSGLLITEQPRLLGLDLSSRESRVYLAAALFVLVYLVVRFIRSGRTGEQWAAVREQEELASAIGIDVRRAKCVALTVGGAIAGLAGPLQAFYMRQVQLSDFAIAAAITIIMMVILGGRLYVVGPLVGALFWYLVPEAVGLSPLLAQAAFGLLLVVAILVWPEGLVLGAVSFVRLASRRGALDRTPERLRVRSELAVDDR